jgi:hypothetical protein
LKRPVDTDEADILPFPTPGYCTLGLTEEAAERDVESTTEPERSGPETAPPSGLRVLTDLELEALPPPEWLIDGILLERGLAVLFGPPSVGKSFLALDWALSLAAGVAWAERPTIQCGVVYIAAEGASGLGSRTRAWKAQHDLESCPGIRFVPQALQLLDDGEAERLVDTFQGLDLDLGLVVIDTLARCFVGGDENSAKDVGRLSVLVVHHTTKTGNYERGSSALRGAADTMISCDKADGVQGISISCEKQKDAETFKDLVLNTQTVQLGNGQTSRVFTGSGSLLDIVVTDLGDKERMVLEELHKLPEGARKTKWQQECEGRGVKERTFHRIAKALQERGLVSVDGEKPGAKFSVTEKGWSLLPSR